MHCGAAADRRSHRAADLAGVSGSVAAGPRKAAVPLGRVAASVGCPEAGACPVAERRALRLMQAIDQSFDCLYDRPAPTSIPADETPAAGTPAVLGERSSGKSDRPNAKNGTRWPAVPRQHVALAGHSLGLVVTSPLVRGLSPPRGAEFPRDPDVRLRSRMIISR
jgi:hypothetical protein